MAEPLDAVEMERVHWLHVWVGAEGCRCDPERGDPVIGAEYTACRCGRLKPAHLPLCRRCYRGKYFPLRWLDNRWQA